MAAQLRCFGTQGIKYICIGVCLCIYMYMWALQDTLASDTYIYDAVHCILLPKML